MYGEQAEWARPERKKEDGEDSKEEAKDKVKKVSKANCELENKEISVEAVTSITEPNLALALLRDSLGGDDTYSSSGCSG